MGIIFQFGFLVAYVAVRIFLVPVHTAQFAWDVVQLVRLGRIEYIPAVFWWLAAMRKLEAGDAMLVLVSKVSPKDPDVPAMRSTFQADMHKIRVQLNDVLG
jgi:hypothetical protein